MNMSTFNSSDVAAFKGGVWVFCEQRQGSMMPTSYELISEGRKLADELGTKLYGILLGDGIEGLVHISEMARQHVDAPAQVTSVGNEVQVKVMEIDLDRRRISLSMKAAAETLGFDVEVTPLDTPEAKEAEVVEVEDGPETSEDAE